VVYAEPIGIGDGRGELQDEDSHEGSDMLANEILDRVSSILSLRGLESAQKP
jgi:hypothetical protein